MTSYPESNPSLSRSEEAEQQFALPHARFPQHIRDFQAFPTGNLYVFDHPERYLIAELMDASECGVSAEAKGEALAIRWDEFPHPEIRLRIYARLAQNGVARSDEDSLRHILRRQLASLDPQHHRRFVELEARSLVEHLRCTRDVYQEFVQSKGCRPVLEAHWVVLRCAVFPTAIAILRRKVIDYAKLTKVAGKDLSLLFGILTRTCYENAAGGLALLCLPDLEDETSATDGELKSLGDLIDEDGLLMFRDIRDDGAVGHLFGGGPFSTDDARSLRNSFGLCGLRAGMTLPEWIEVRDKLWNLRSPWTEGLCNLFGSVQEELMSQWRALPLDSRVHQLELEEKARSCQAISVPAEEKTSRPISKKPGPSPKLPEAFVICAGTLWQRAISDNHRKVSKDQLRQIAAALDAAGHSPPSSYLEGKYARDLRDFNSRNSNSKIGPLRTWSQLLSHADKDHVQGMRRLLSRCAEKVDRGRPLSGINSGQEISS